MPAGCYVEIDRLMLRKIAFLAYSCVRSEVIEFCSGKNSGSQGLLGKLVDTGLDQLSGFSPPLIKILL